jgi:hypothetical protein
MILYILMDDGGYDGDTFLGVYDSREKAEEAMTAEETYLSNGKTYPLAPDGFILKWELNSPPRPHYNVRDSR